MTGEEARRRFASARVARLATADAATLDVFRRAGVTRVVRWLPTGPRSHIEKALDRWEQAIAELIGA